MKIGITGHQELDHDNLWNWVESELSLIIKDFTKQGETVGISSLAIGADQMFARIILSLKGKLLAVIPFPDYERTFKKSDLNTYKKLLEMAFKTEVLPKGVSDEESFFAAGKKVVELADIILAVWDGKKAEGLGGTGDVVSYAKKTGKKVILVNPYSKKTLSS
jgi:hypothetical protein